jgi:hypothetical protein
MLFFMGASAHLGGSAALPFTSANVTDIGFILIILLILALEANAIKGKLVKPITSIVAVVHSSLALTFVMLGLTML